LLDPKARTHHYNQQTNKANQHLSFKMSNWFASIHSDAVALEDDGTDFLKTEKLAPTKLGSHAVKVKVNNVTGHFGGPKPKKKTKEYKAMIVQELTNMVDFAAILTGNDVHVAALPIDVSTVRNYNLIDKGYVLPPYQSNDQSTLMYSFIVTVEEAYKDFCAKDKQDFVNSGGLPGGYMEKTEFATVLKPKLAEIIRYCIKFWYLHPWLSRMDAYEQAIAHMGKHVEKKTDCKKLIDDVLNERKDVLMKQEVLNLKTIVSTEDAAYQMFEDNESAQLVMTKFLKHHQFKLDKNSLDVLEDMHRYLEGLEAAEKTEFEMFRTILPRETAVYKDKKRKAEEEAQKKERQKQEKEARESLQLEKKQKLLEENAKKTAEAEEAAKKAAAEKAAASTTTGTSGGTAAAAAAAAAKDVVAEEVDDVVPDASDKYAEYKYRIGSHVIIDQMFPRGTTGRNQTKIQNQMANASIQKTITALNGKTVVVQYTKPGEYWVKAIGTRIGNVATAVSTFNEKHPAMVEASIASFNSKSTLSADCSRVILAIMLHASAQDDKEIKQLGCHANFYEKNFIADLKNTKALWLPTLHAGSLIHLYGLYQLVCAEETMSGKTSAERTTLIEQVINDKGMMAPEKAKQVVEIMHILRVVDDEIVEEKFGLLAGATDPFDTKSHLVEE
jgi:hypothetical protein